MKQNVVDLPPIPPNDEQTFDLDQAAAFLKMHPETVRIKAKNGEIPGAKLAKCWVFLKSDLVDYVRNSYIQPRRTVEAEQIEGKKCKSSRGKNRRSTGSLSPSVANEYAKALEY